MTNSESAGTVKTAGNHRWKFFRYGGIDQVSLETGADLLALERLDPKLWAAMICPVHNIEFDAKTLEYLDTDNDKRIKITEVIAGLKWVCSVLRNPDDLINSRETLSLTMINSETAEGATILASARQILKNLGREQADAISLADLADTRKIFSATAFNGDGIVICESAGDEQVRRLIAEIIDCSGGAVDRSGKPGIAAEHLQKFMSEAAAYSAWIKKAEDSSSGIMFAGAETDSLAACYQKVKARIDDYFTRCSLAAFDARYAQAGQALEQDYIALLKKSLSSQTGELKEFPLAMISTGQILPLAERINPAWADEMADFRARVVKSIIGDVDKLDQAQWQTIKGRFKAYETWQSEKAGFMVEKLGLARVTEILNSGLDGKITDLIAHDLRLEPEFNAINTVDKLLRYYCHIYTLLNSFVAFKDFYSGRNRAVFQVGTLYLDSRSCDLCVRVDDVNKHSVMATACNTFLVYCECSRQGSSEKMFIAAAFTDGDSDQLLPGRNGLFLDRKGNYWDAIVVKIIDHPISIRQAFWAPYRRIGRMIQEQIEKFASAKDKSVTDSLSASVAETGAKLDAPAPAAQPAPPFDVGKFAGIFAAIGLALAAIGSAIASVVSGFLGLLWWQMPLAAAGIIMLISGPSMVLAAMRLRHRNLGSILDANGWAVNSKAQINLAFGKTLTSMAELPRGAIRSFDDPFAERKSPWKLYLLLILIVVAALVWLQTPGACDYTRSLIGRIVKCETPCSSIDGQKPADCSASPTAALSAASGAAAIPGN